MWNQDLHNKKCRILTFCDKKCCILATRQCKTLLKDAKTVFNTVEAC